MIVAGLDLSLTGTGVVVTQDGKIVVQKLIKSKPSGDTPTDEIIRLRYIRDSIKLALTSFPDLRLVAIEGLAFMARNTGAIMQLAGLNYMVRDMLYSMDINFVIVAPTTLKKFITGKGVGPKDVMMLEIYKRYRVSFTDNNIADAYGLAKVCESLLGEKCIKTQEETINILKKQL